MDVIVVSMMLCHGTRPYMRDFSGFTSFQTNIASSRYSEYWKTMLM